MSSIDIKTPSMLHAITDEQAQAELDRAQMTAISSEVAALRLELRTSVDALRGSHQARGRHVDNTHTMVRQLLGELQSLRGEVREIRDALRARGPGGGG